MSMAYIRKTYGVPAKRGMRVVYTLTSTNGGPLREMKGVITGSKEGRLRVRFDDGHPKDMVTLHPTWNLEYVQ